jgi:hypothetical protein
MPALVAGQESLLIAGLLHEIDFGWSRTSIATSIWCSVSLRLCEQEVEIASLVGQ